MTDVDRELARLEVTEVTVCFDWECGYVESCAGEGGSGQTVFDNLITQIINLETKG